MEKADIAVVYFSPHALELKKLPMLLPADIVNAFQKKGLHVFSDSSLFQQYLLNANWENSNLLLMSSGDFDGLNVKAFTEELKF